MSNRIFLAIVLSSLLIGTLTLALNNQPVKASGSIYIRADSSIDPPTAPISTLDNVTYTLTGNVTSSVDGIIVERGNTIIDGNQFTVQGSGTSNGINVTGGSNVTVKNTVINNFVRGIYLDQANGTTISGNNITNNDYGVKSSSSFNVSISGNNITATSEYGIWLASSSNDSISGNNITANNSYGIYLASSSSNNSISGNNIANNPGGIPSGGIVLIYSSDNNNIFENKITNSSMGLWLDGCSENNIYGNNIVDNGNGIVLESSSNNSIIGNNITANNGNFTYLEFSGNGVYLESSSNNNIFHNNFVNNNVQANSTSDSANTWDDGYLPSGNYWSDYNGTDANHDSIGDTPYLIDVNNTDYYPLMRPYIIPEFPSLLILPLLTIATLLGAIIYKKKAP